ncbi:MAG: AI-2E family transporter [Azospirillaceae bacterium]
MPEFKDPQIPVLRLAAIVALAIMLGWVLWVGRPILLPLVMALLLAFVLTELAIWIGSIRPLGPRLPGWLRYVIALAIVAVVIWGLARLVTVNIGNVVAALPTYQSNLEGVLLSLYERFGIEEPPTLASIRDEIFRGISLQGLVRGVLTQVTTGFGTVVIVLTYMAFLLLEQRTFARKLTRLADDEAGAERIAATLHEINDRVGRYLVLKATVSLLVGAGSWIVMILIGIDFAGFWAVLIFLLNFVPYIGSFVGVLFPTVLAAVQFAAPGPFLTALVALTAVQVVVGSFVEPRLMGRSLNLSPLVVLLSLSVWGSLWGIVGALLCVPMTVVLLIIFARFEVTRPVAILLSQDGRIAGEGARPAEGDGASD